MLTSWRRMLVGAVAAGVVLACLASASQAQVVRVSPNRMAQFQPYVNPNYPVAPGLTLSQYNYNVESMGRAYQSVPPWVYGYNPYPAPYVNYGPVYRYRYSPVYPVYTPYYYGAPVYNPYGYGYSPYNPYFP